MISSSGFEMSLRLQTVQNDNFHRRWSIVRAVWDAIESGHNIGE